MIIGETPADALAAAGVDTRHTWAEVPWRTILASVGVVLATYLLIRAVLLAVDVITWVAIAGFFAIVLAPATRAVQDRVGGRRNLATGIVVFSTLAAVMGALTLFLMPVRTQLIAIITDLPGTVNDAAAGKGPIGHLVTQLHLTNLVHDHQAELTKAANDLSSSSFQYATAVFQRPPRFRHHHGARLPVPQPGQADGGRRPRTSCPTGGASPCAPRPSTRPRPSAATWSATC